MKNASENICPKCHFSVSETAYFCSNCGNSLKQKPISTSAASQLMAYTISLFLPPSGFYYTYRYFKLGTRTGKIIAWFTIILTTVSLFVNWALFKNVIGEYQQFLNQFQNLGM